MNGPRLALIADDQRLAGGLLAYFEKTLSLVLWQCSFEGIRRYPVPESDGLFLLASGSPADSEQVRRLVQEIYLQKLPIVCLVVETEAARAGRDLAPLDAYVARRLLWPAEASIVGQFVRDRAARIPHATPMIEETIEEVVRRRLISQTPSLLPLVERIALAAQHDVTVLLTGETGTGKTFLARLMHECSPRQDSSVLCGAVRGAAAEPAGERVLRPRPRRVHRGRPGQGRQVRGGWRGHHPAGRDRHHPAGAAGGAVARDRNRGVRAGRRQRGQAVQGPHHRRQQLGPGRGGASRADSARTCTIAST